MNRLNTREKNLVTQVFDRCSRIAHAQAGNHEITDGSAVNSIWRMAAIAIHQDIEIERGRVMDAMVEYAKTNSEASSRPDDSQ